MGNVRHYLGLAALLLAALTGTTKPAWGQNSSLFSQPGGNGTTRPLTLPSASLTYIALPPPKKIELHDLIIVKVDELARMSSDGELSRRKNSSLTAQLKDWILWPELFTIKPDPQADGDQTVDGSLQQQIRATNELETRESLMLNIACEIVDIRPNGLLVLEGHKRIGVNEETWEVSLTGLCRRDDILPDNTVFSRNVLDLRLDKRDHGQIRDGYRRGWFTRWYDQFNPF